MRTNTNEPIGLTRVIYEILRQLNTDVAAEGQRWSMSLLGEVERELKRQLPAPANPRDRAIFNMMVGRSFKEARDLLLSEMPRRCPGAHTEEVAASVA